MRLQANAETEKIMEGKRNKKTVLQLILIYGVIQLYLVKYNKIVN